MAVQVNIYKNSGTVAGNVYVETSLDLVNWSNAYASYIAPSGDISNYNYSVSDVAGQVFRFNLPNWADLYIRVRYTGSGTMAAGFSATLFARKEVH